MILTPRTLARAACATLAPALVLLALLAGCSKPAEPDASDPEAISNRPQQYDRFIAIVKLQSPALLTSARQVDGVLTVDPALKDRVLAEQDDFIADLAEHHPEAQVLSRYRFVLNAVTIVAPVALKDEFAALPAVSFIEASQPFARAVVAPAALEAAEPAAHAFGGVRPADRQSLADDNSATFIGSRRVHDDLRAPLADGTEAPVDGRGIKVGIIDTGIDYTHKAFGGVGTRAAYLANDPRRVERGTFPTAKVVGGIDLVGATYDSNSPRFADHLPIPDADPLDVQGHGSHVAATVAGRGDGVNTYDGVAPGASLYAIKVFADGAWGATADHVVISAFEYAVDPDGDLDPADKLDVVNVSLGSDFGTPHILYEEALGNLVGRGDVVAVCSAGNSGDFEFVVGSPSTAPDAISVAASIDATVSGGTFADTLAVFSSRGPRSLDGLFKPEVAAPGYQILSVDVGTGMLGTRMNGTSMAAPHVAGVAALLRQLHRDERAAAIKSRIVDTARGMKDRQGHAYPLARQGSGRVQAYEAATTTLTLDPPAISLGVLQAEARTTAHASVRVTNSGPAQTVKLAYAGSAGITPSGDASVELAAGETRTLAVAFAIDPARLPDGQSTVEASIALRKPDGTALAHVPALALVRRPTRIAAAAVDAAPGATSVTLANTSAVAGPVEAFLDLGTDERIAGVDANPSRDGACDLESAGWRVVDQTDDGVTRPVLQIAVALHQAVTSWHLCDVSVQIDREGDGRPEQELVGTFLATLSDSTPDGDGRFESLLLDFDRMVERRRQYERQYDIDQPPTMDYLSAALVGRRPFRGAPQSAVAIVEADLAAVAAAADGSFHVKIGVLGLALTGPSNDDFLGEGQGYWVRLAPANGRLGAGASTSVAGEASTRMTLDAAPDDVVLFAPANAGGATPWTTRLSRR
jgi:subtilisin family serine protease